MDLVKEEEMRKLFQIGGFVSAAVLIAFGIGAIVMGVNGRSTVQDSLKQEFIVGSPDMTPTLIKAEAKEAGLDVATLSLPTVNVAGKAINNGTKGATCSYSRTARSAGWSRSSRSRRWPALDDQAGSFIQLSTVARSILSSNISTENASAL
jgi:hypothetical protein